MKANLVTEFETISTAGGYNTDPVQVIPAIRQPNDIQDFPEIGIECGVERVRAEDAAWVVFESTVPVLIVAAVKASTDLGDEATNLEAAVEDIRQDMKRVIASIVSKYMNEAGNEWIIAANANGIEVGAVEGQGLKRNIATVGCTFDVLLRNQDGDF
jgi:hypothetical protein